MLSRTCAPAGGRGPGLPDPAAPPPALDARASVSARQRPNGSMSQAGSRGDRRSRVTEQAIPILGGNGLTRELPGRAVAPGRQDLHDLRGQTPPNPAPDHRPPPSPAWMPCGFSANRPPRTPRWVRLSQEGRNASPSMSVKPISPVRTYASYSTGNFPGQLAQFPRLTMETWRPPVPCPLPRNEHRMTYRRPAGLH